MSTTTTTGTWHDEYLEPACRAELLQAEMTTAEKCHQLTARMSWSPVKADRFDLDEAEEVLRNPHGHLGQLILDDPAQLASMVETIERQVMSRSGLGIPVLSHADALGAFPADGHMGAPGQGRGVHRDAGRSSAGVWAGARTANGRPARRRDRRQSYVGPFGTRSVNQNFCSSSSNSGPPWRIEHDGTSAAGGFRLRRGRGCLLPNHRQ
jgi:hypothetical protein